MSRVGKLPITIPQGAKATVQGNLVQIEGPQGKLQYHAARGLNVSVSNGKMLVALAPNAGAAVNLKQLKADYGTTRAHLNNMMIGVTKGWKRSLELFGVGFNAKSQGDKLQLAVGFSHEVNFQIPKGIKCTVNKSSIEMESCDKELLGTFASKVRMVQPPEPYLGKGIKYSDEVVRRKAGKTGKK